MPGIGSILSNFRSGGQKIMDDAGTVERQTKTGLQSLYDRFAGAKSSFGGLNTIGDVRTRFGLSDADIAKEFDPLRQALQAKKGRAMSDASARLGRTAQPEKTFSQIESSALDAGAGIDAEQSKRKNETIMMAARLLQDSLAQQDQFGSNQIAMLSQLLGQRFGVANQGAMRQLQEPGTGDYLLSALKGASSFLI